MPGIGSLIGNIIWIILFGWELALGHLITGVLLCITIIGIPLGLANFKIIPISLVPLGVARRAVQPALSGLSLTCPGRRTFGSCVGISRSCAPRTPPPVSDQDVQAAAIQLCRQ